MRVIIDGVEYVPVQVSKTAVQLDSPVIAKAVKNACKTCGKEVLSMKVVNFSTENYGEVYCFDCQKKQTPTKQRT